MLFVVAVALVELAVTFGIIDGVIASEVVVSSVDIDGTVLEVNVSSVVLNVLVEATCPVVDGIVLAEVVVSSVVFT